MKKTMSMVALATISMMALVGCDSTVTTDSKNAKATGAVALHINTVATGAALDSVTVTLVGQTKEVVQMTNVSGDAYFSKLPVGSHLFKIEKSGFAPVYYMANLMVDNGLSDVPLVIDVDEQISLYRLGTTLTGRVQVANVDAKGYTQISTSAGMPVILTIDDLATNGTLVQNTFIATTDAGGYYSFTNLPEQVTVKVAPQNYTDTLTGKMYKGTERTAGGLVLGESDIIAAITMNVVAPELLVYTTNFAALKLTDSLLLTFSEAVDISRIIRGDIIVENPNGDILGITAAWSNGNKTLTIKPVGGTWWNLGDHTLNLELSSTKGNALSYSEDFAILYSGAVALVTGVNFTADYSSLPGNYKIQGDDTTVANEPLTSITLHWAPLAGVTGYDVYKKVGDDAYTWYTAADANDTSAIININNDLEGDTVYLKIVGFNSNTTGDIVAATAIVVRDAVKPGIVGGSNQVMNSETDTLFFTSTLNNTNGSQDEEVDSWVCNFSEKMNQTLVPLITSIYPTQVRIESEWLDENSLEIRKYVRKGADNDTAPNTPVTLAVDMNMVKDLSGNVCEDKIVLIYQ